jgi:type III restriction enzyme
MNYVPTADGMFSPEYAEVYGVPFSFIPCSGSTVEPKPGPIPTRVRALEDRIACEIAFPRVAGYRYDLPGETITAKFTNDSKLALSTADVPTRVENAPIVGEISIHTLDDLKRRREQEVAFLLAKLTLEKYFRDDEGATKHWIFPRLVEIARDWMQTCLKCKDNTFPQMLLFVEIAHDASDRIYHSVVASHEGEKALKPILEPYNTLGSTRYVDFDTTRPVYATNPRYCHVSHVVADTKSWEQKMAQALEELGDDGIVLSYVKNQNLNYQIPYTINGDEHRYLPDFLVRIDDGHGPGDPLNLIVEVTGEHDKDKAAKVSTARNLWVPAVNNHGGFGRWAFLEIDDPWDAERAIKAHLKEGADT